MMYLRNMIRPPGQSAGTPPALSPLPKGGKLPLPKLAPAARPKTVAPTMSSKSPPGISVGMPGSHTAPIVSVTAAARGIAPKKPAAPQQLVASASPPTANAMVPPPVLPVPLNSPLNAHPAPNSLSVHPSITSTLPTGLPPALMDGVLHTSTPTSTTATFSTQHNPCYSVLKLAGGKPPAPVHKLPKSVRSYCEL
jgi:hypothetical protein